MTPEPMGAEDTDSDPLCAVVLAGGEASDRLARTVGAPGKALVPLAGRAMGAYVLDALVGSRCVGRIVWVGHADAAMAARVDTCLPPGRRLTDSLAIGLGAALASGPKPRRVLVLSVDIPWITAEGLDAFVAGAPPRAELVYPVIDRAVMEARFPEVRRTWVRLRDGEVTGGNVVLAEPEVLVSLLPWIERATRIRKSPWLLASLLGLPAALSVLTGLASVSQLERRVGERLGVRAHAARTRDAALGNDVDRPDQLPATLELREAAPVEPAS